LTIDAYCTRFLGLKPSDVLMIGMAEDHGLGRSDLSGIVVKTAEV
jgi:hypothetical protein